MLLTGDKCSDYLKCQKCNQIFEDPRSLPCGECICNSCIQSNIEKGSNQFNCFCCKKMHCVPDIGGFPICKIMVSLLNKNPKVDISSENNEMNNFKNELEEMRDYSKKLSFKVEMSDEIISEHCGMIKNQVEMKVQNIIQKIQNSKYAFLQEVEKYEMNCKDSIKNKKHHRFESTINESVNLYNEYKSQLVKKDVIDESELVEMKTKTFIQKNILKDEFIHLNLMLFNQKRIILNDFLDNEINSLSIGSIVSEPLRDFNFKSYTNKVDLKLKLESYHHVNCIMIFESNDKFVVFYHDASNHKVISIFDNHFNVIKTAKISSIFNIKNELTISAKCTLQNEIMINYNPDNNDSNYYLAIIDQNLKLTKEAQCRNSYNLICANAHTVIGLNLAQMDIYDSKFKLLKTVGQTNRSLPYFIDFYNTLQIETLNRKIILRSNNRIRIIDLNNGMEEVSIDVYIYQMILNDNKLNVIAFNDDEEFEFQVYYLNGKLQAKYPMMDFTEDYLLSYNNNKVNFLWNKYTLELKHIQ
jgi:hypothetical protein